MAADGSLADRTGSVRRRARSPEAGGAAAKARGAAAKAGGAAAKAGGAAAWTQIRDQLRSRGLRWTPQRRLILDVLEATDGHVTGSELVERCRELDPDTTPSTVYRTLDVLEGLGFVNHSHSAMGREEFHVLPTAEHAHLQCRDCGRTWELDAREASALVRPVQRRFGFVADVGHLTIAGLCAECLRGVSV